MIDVDDIEYDMTKLDSDGNQIHSWDDVPYNVFFLWWSEPENGVGHKTIHKKKIRFTHQTVIRYAIEYRLVCGVWFVWNTTQLMGVGDAFFENND